MLKSRPAGDKIVTDRRTFVVADLRSSTEKIISSYRITAKSFTSLLI